MRIEHYSEQKLKKEIKKIVGKHLNLNDYKVFFFGSRVNGKNISRSDIDIGIEGEKPLDIGILACIKEEVSNLPILYKIDIVDFKSVDEDFYKVSKQNIEIIN